MEWKLEIIDSAIKELDKLGVSSAKLILKRFQERVLSQKNPTSYAKPLKQELFGFWRLRIDDYRVIFRVLSDKKIVQITRIGHRKDIYKE